MSDSAAPVSICVVGSTGLIGQAISAASIGRTEFRLTALARREQRLPVGAKMDMIVADPANWGDLLAEIRPTAMICALGTTWRKAGANEDAFRAVDYDLVVDTAQAASKAGVEQFVVVSSIGANPLSKGFYLRVKGDMERALKKLPFERLDILKAGLLRGDRNRDMRPAEQFGHFVSPVTDLLLHGKFRDYRSIHDDIVAQATLQFAMNKVSGTFIHTHDGIRQAAREFIDREQN